MQDPYPGSGRSRSVYASRIDIAVRGGQGVVGKVGGVTVSSAAAGPALASGTPRCATDLSSSSFGVSLLSLILASLPLFVVRKFSGCSSSDLIHNQEKVEPEQRDSAKGWYLSCLLFHFTVWTETLC